ncbi:hypothetical protein POTOM_000946 [Populus tomentosa]|uniref:DUF7054 domain-containing protein n=1 Tax=Populus tomentosa TaxID=118781 RepID=A0A8X8DH33_POPTO|nr:hypothetical protein POTOM_000946 [Populus tomentosa]
MPKRDVRRRVPENGGRKIRPPHPSPSPSPSRTEDSVDQQKQRSSILLYESDGGRGGVLFRPHTCTDVLASSPSLIVPTNFSPRSSLDQKGVQGQLRAMVKLGSNVEDTIKLVVDKYSEEGRTLKLDKNAASTCELHHSSFSLQSKSFYLGSSSSNRRSNGGSASSITETVSGRANPPPPPPIPCPPFLIPEFFASKFGKVVRRTLQPWKVLVCWK